MVSTQEYMSSVDDIMSDYLDDGEIAVYFETTQEAKHHLKTIRLKQKQLRMVKKDVKHSMKIIRSSFTAKSAEVGKPSLKTGFMSGLIGKKKAGKLNALTKESLRRQRDDMLEPYDSVVHRIDSFLLSFDNLKLQLDKWLLDNK